MTSVSARRLAAMKSRESIIAAVSVRWLTSDPDRGRQDEPVWSFKALDGLVAEKFQAVAALDQRDAFGRQALEFDRSHFRAILLALALALRLFVVVELRVRCDLRHDGRG